MAKVIWTAQSLDDIENIAQFIAKNSFRYAQIQTQRFFDKVKVLEKFSESGRVVPELKDDKIRELAFNYYRIIYRIVSNEEIHILTIHHSNRLLSNNPLFE